MGSKDLFVFLFVLAGLLLNWPFLSIFKISLPYYLFGMWAGIIFLIGIIVSVRTKGDVS
jgi:hypothetical protein